MSSVRAADIALNFQYGGGTVAGNTVDGMSDWVDSSNTSSGTVAGLGGGLVTATYYASGGWHAGQSGNPNQTLYYQYLDDSDYGTSYYSGDGIGVSVTLTGLSSWLSSVGASAYELRFYESNDWSAGPMGNADTGFAPIDIREGAPVLPAIATGLTSLPILYTVAAMPPSATHDGGYDSSAGYIDTGIGGTRDRSDSVPLTADTITATLSHLDWDVSPNPAYYDGYWHRANLAAIAVIAVPEPATWVLGLMALACGMLIRRYRGK
ncbi:MAG: PEP-CTERM sorting domain-containing protein [Thermoguttaceae bacterium]